ncbi:MAG: SUMF1/EgtB/PvdO family nonheme iron enzyme, partial [Deltaproteobacteria bacterium]|nr:SUMF1/EgtB/PvdO family nonheme iron enzyme [Deltaproteobacteria bacterium]
MTHAQSDSRLLSLVFTDLKSSTELKTRLGDRAAGKVITHHHALVHRLLEETGGREIDSAGDGFFLTFEAPSQAAAFALQLQREHQREESLPAVRIGIHLGEVTERESPEGSSKSLLVEGLAVDIAARIESLARPGQILLSAPVFDSARQRLKGQTLGGDISWLDHGPYLLKGIEDAVAICEVGFSDFSPLAPPPDSDKARRAGTPGSERTLGWRPAVGSTVPHREHWVLKEQLGTGAIGEVWLAEHQKTHTKRVFKFCFEIDRVRGLQREAVLLRLLKEKLGDRQDIAQVIDWEFDRAPYYLEMEHAEAGDLVQWSNQKGGLVRVPLATRLEIVAQVAEALEAAHSVGVLHKDLKPANILIREETSSGKPRACLTDFGIGLVTSRAALESPGVTSVGLTETLVSSDSTTGAGTRLYMAPEVIEGRAATPQSDIYALGVLLYQMVGGDFSHSLAPGWEREVGDESLLADITECVDGDPERRLAHASELAERLRGLGSRRHRLRARRGRRLALTGAVVLGLVLLVGLFGAGLLQQRAKIRWAQETAIPRIGELVTQEAYFEAFALAEEARVYLPNDPTLNQWRARASNTISVHTEPAGAEVFVRRYSDTDAAWQSLGPTPLDELRLPLGLFRWRVEKEGYEPVEIARFVVDPSIKEFRKKTRGIEGDPTYDIDLELSASGSLPPGMIAVEAAKRGASITASGPSATVLMPLARFLIDRTEVTNAQFKEFVDAGGYRNPEYWKEPFVHEGHTLAFGEAMQRFRDSTGRPGPATWMLGDFPEATADFPVGGVSWFEASAYAAFRGKDLPTVHHWRRAAEFPDTGYDIAPALISLSNFDGAGPAPVASHPGISVSGASDMAGNVREWSSTALGDGRFLIGGAWNDASYEFNSFLFAHHSPWERAPQNGFRCVQYLSGAGLDELQKPIDAPEIDIERAMKFSFSDEVWAVIKNSAAYDPTALDPILERVEENASGRIEWIRVAAIPGDERLLLRLHFPPASF